VALLPPQFSNAVIALETREEQGDDSTYHTVATGTLLAFRIDMDTPEAGGHQYALWLVTNKHVVQDARLWARFNRGETSDRFELDLVDPAGNPVWRGHPDFDVTVTAINPEALESAGAEFHPITDDLLLSTQRMRDLGVSAGDDLFVLGFPLGFGGRDRKYVVARHGSIARLDEEIVDDAHAYLVDCITFPGNSGGPVVLRPTLTSLEGIEPINKAHVIGIVSAYMPYTDVAVSRQTQQPRVTFEENSGLTWVVPIDAVEDLVGPTMTQLREAHGQQQQSEASETGADGGEPG
jgi:hypothetical protein